MSQFRLTRIISSALCYCTTELLSSRHAGVRRLSSSVDIVFSDTTEWFNAKFWGQVPIHHISRPFFFQNFKFLIFYDHISSESTNHIHSQKSCILLARVSTKVAQRILKFQSLYFCHFFFFFFFIFVNMGPYGGNSFKRHLLWNITPDLLPKIHAYSWGGSLTKLLKE